MKIFSDDRRTSLELVQNDRSDRSFGYTFQVSIHTPDGCFYGRNCQVHFSDFRAFYPTFKNLVRTRNGGAALELTEGCRLEFFRWNEKGDLGCRVTVSKWTLGTDPVRTTPVSVTGEFKISMEYVNNIEREFKLLDPESSVQELP